MQQADDDRLEKGTKNSNRTPSPVGDGSRAVIKPVSGTLYDRPRLAPKINRPVPKNAAAKFAYKPIGSPTAMTVKDEQYINEEEMSAVAESAKEESSTSTSKPFSEIQNEEPSRPYKRTKLDSNPAEAPRVNIRKRPVPTTEISTVSEEISPASHEETTSPKLRTIMRKFRRPFLPSRGGNPYTARNLRPVGDKVTDSDESVADVENSSEVVSGDDYEEEEIQERRSDKMKPVRVKSPLSIVISDEIRTSSESRDSSNSTPFKMKLPIKSSLARDNTHKEQKMETTESSSIEKLYENYDEILNEASPVLTFPIQKYTAGLGNSNNYLYSNRYYN